MKNKKKGSLTDKLDMYDIILADIMSSNAVSDSEFRLSNEQIEVGYADIKSNKQVNKYYIIKEYPDYIKEKLIDIIRRKCCKDGVAINFSFYAKKYVINWGSDVMKDKIKIWKKYYEEGSNTNAFNYRQNRTGDLRKERIATSTKYFNVAELDQQRSTINATIIIKVSAGVDELSLMNMCLSCHELTSYCNSAGLELKEIKRNVIEWLKFISPFGQVESKGIANRIIRKTMTDDVLALTNSYRQGIVGDGNVVLAMDVLNGLPILYNSETNNDDADNWLISASTGGGKSWFIKNMLSWLVVTDCSIIINDYEGDEYTNFAAYIKAGNPEDVRVVSMGKGDAYYFDPCVIGELTGNDDIDKELKESAVSYIMNIFRVIVKGIDNDFERNEKHIISMCIDRMYLSYGVTDDKSTWKFSDNARLSDVYTELKLVVDKRELIDIMGNEELHRVADDMLDACSIFFSENGVNRNVFKNAITLDEIVGAKLLVFSFGNKGEEASLTDKTILALKQLSVSYIGTRIANYNKYIKHRKTFKVWEEANRWFDIKGSRDIIVNDVTGGRKRGVVNIILTNKLDTLLNENDNLGTTIAQNIQNYAIGAIEKSDIRDKFCKEFSLMECKGALDLIAKNSKAGSVGENKFKKAFCIVLKNGDRAIGKVRMAPEIAASKVFESAGGEASSVK